MLHPVSHNSQRFSDILVELEETRRALGSQLASMGEMPPQPPTARGRLGATLVSVVRRAMFWYIAQDNEYRKQQLKLLDSMLAALKIIMAENQQNWALLQNIHTHDDDTYGATDELEKRLVSHDGEIKRVLDTALRAEAKARAALEVMVEDQMNEFGALVKNLSGRQAPNHLRPDATRENR